MQETLLILMLITLCGGLLSGYPVAFVLGGTGALFAVIGHMLGVFDMAFMQAAPERIWSILTNPLLLAIPLFVCMGTMLQKSDIAEELLQSLSHAFSRLPAGLGLAVMLVGALLAASTGIVGATVVTMGMISLPSMLRNGYHPATAAGAITASGTLGQIIPPSIVLILLGDQMSAAYQSAQMQLGNLAATPLSVADLFAGALVPGLLLVALYCLWLLLQYVLFPSNIPRKTRVHDISISTVLKALLPPLLLILVVLGSILAGVATATEASALGALGAFVIALCKKRVSGKIMCEVAEQTTETTCMIFMILIGAAVFSLAFRGYGGDEYVAHMLQNLPGGLPMVLLCTMLLLFVLGFFLDFIEIIYVVIPIIAPILCMMGADPVWLAVLVALNLQTSFLTPPFGFALFYLRGVAPKEVSTSAMYKGVLPFIVIQLLLLLAVYFLPQLATWLPEQLYGTVFESYVPPADAVEYGVDF